MRMRLASDPLVAGASLFVIVATEAVILLGVLGMGHEPLVHHDYRQYHLLGVNLLDHATLSDDDAAPVRATLFRPPGYPAFIAVVYLLTGRSILAVRVTQFILLWLTALLLYLLGRRFFSPGTALLGAVFAATYPPFVFMMPLYQAHAMTFFGAVAALLLAAHLKDQQRPSAWLALAIGLILGVTALARPAFTLVVAFLAGPVLFGEGWKGSKRRLGAAACLCIGYSLIVLPWVARNNVLTEGRSGTRIMSGGWQLYTSALQYTGVISHQVFKHDWDLLVNEFNERNARVAKTVPPDAANALALQELEVERSYVLDSISQLREADAFQLLRTLPSRFFWLWSTGDNSPWQTGLFHRLVQGYHVLLAALGLCGLFLNRGRLLAQWPLWLFAVYQTLLHLIFHVEARFTLEARLFLCLYAAAAFIWFWTLCRQWWASPEQRAHEVRSVPIVVHTSQ